MEQDGAAPRREIAAEGALLAPSEAFILVGFADDPDDAARALLHRLVAEAGRHGFGRVHLVHPPEKARLLRHVIGTLPDFPARPEVTAMPAAEPLAALRARPNLLEPWVMLVAGGALAQVNWLDPLAESTTTVDGVLAAPRAAAEATGEGAPPHRPFATSAGLLLLRREIVPAVDGPETLDGLIGDLAAAGRLALRPFPATAVRPAAAGMALRPRRPALFIDRDGTLNVDFGFVADPARLILLPGAARAVKRANDLGYYVFLVTNQSGIGCGLYSEADMLACNAALQRRLRAAGAHLDDIRFCADHPEAITEAYRRPSGWRKPAPGMLIDLMAHWPVDRQNSLMVGDKLSDMAAGRAAGVRSLRFTGGDLDATLAPALAAAARA